jgi:hypothetical protein
MIFGKRVDRRMHGELATVIDQIEHGHHVFHAYFQSAQPARRRPHITHQIRESAKV